MQHYSHPSIWSDHMQVLYPRRPTFIKCNRTFILLHPNIGSSALPEPPQPLDHHSFQHVAWSSLSSDAQRLPHQSAFRYGGSHQRNIKTLLRRGRGAGLYEFWCRALLPYLFVSSIIVLVRGGARKLSVPGCVLTLGRNLDLRRLHKRRIRIGVSKHLAGRVGNVSGIKSGL
jgi:hypothetical protein